VRRCIVLHWLWRIGRWADDVGLMMRGLARAAGAGLLGLAVAGCGTVYKDMEGGRGVQALQMAADVWRIEARGNAYTDANIVKDYMLLKAAETAKQNGGSHFIIVEQADASAKSSTITPGARQSVVAGNTRRSVYMPSTISRQMLPGQDAYIRVIKIADGEAAPPEAKSADEIIKYIGGRIPRG
jgi:hypothetical protein